MVHIKLRDRDAITTKEGLIFRVYGYSHPPDAYFCDPEYSPKTLFKSSNPKKAIREKDSEIYYKFYEDEGQKFIHEKYPRYLILHEQLRKPLVGVFDKDISEVRRTEEVLQRLRKRKKMDGLLEALHEVLQIIMSRSNLSQKDFGVFGSILHGFYHPKYSDLDFIIYGQKALADLQETLSELYCEQTLLRNEFEGMHCLEGKRWKFRNYSPEEIILHQKRKLIYASLDHKKNGRVIKTEFEPVKKWEEIFNEYNPNIRIVKKGWIKAIARIIDDSDAPFMPSVYQIEPMKILSGQKVDEIQRIQSFVEEFRIQAKRDEEVYVEGNLEQVSSPSNMFHQITLTYCPRYYEQVLKVLKP